MPQILSGNNIVANNSYLTEGVEWGPLVYKELIGYFDIPIAGAATFPIKIESSIKGQPIIENFTIPVGAFIYATGIKVPELNLAGQPVDLSGTGTDPLLIGVSSATTGTARLAQVGGVLSPGENVVVDMAPTAEGAELVYTAAAANAITSAGAATRCFAKVAFAVPKTFGNPEDAMIFEAPVYTY